MKTENWRQLVGFGTTVPRSADACCARGAFCFVLSQGAEWKVLEMTLCHHEKKLELVTLKIKYSKGSIKYGQRTVLL